MNLWTQDTTSGQASARWRKEAGNPGLFRMNLDWKSAPRPASETYFCRSAVPGRSSQNPGRRGSRCPKGDRTLTFLNMRFTAREDNTPLWAAFSGLWLLLQRKLIMNHRKLDRLVAFLGRGWEDLPLGIKLFSNCIKMRINKWAGNVFFFLCITIRKVMSLRKDGALHPLIIGVYISDLYRLRW